MRRLVPWLLVALCTSLVLPQTGNVRTFRGRGFLLGIAEPQGWVINMDAPQLAQFVLHRQGLSWREANSIIFVRLIPRKDQESAQQFVESNVEDFEKSCLAPEVKDVDLDLKGDRKFWIKSYDCAATRFELTAVTEVPGFFSLLVLTSRGGPPAQPALDAYREVLSSFFWQDTASQPVPDPQGRSR